MVIRVWNHFKKVDKGNINFNYKRSRISKPTTKYLYTQYIDIIWKNSKKHSILNSHLVKKLIFLMKISKYWIIIYPLKYAIIIIYSHIYTDKSIFSEKIMIKFFLVFKTRNDSRFRSIVPSKTLENTHLHFRPILFKHLSLIYLLF